MPNLLKKLKIGEVALVDKGAGEGVHVKIVKRDTGFFKKIFGKDKINKQENGGNPMSLEEILAKLGEEEKAVVLQAIEAAAQKQTDKADDEPADNKPAEDDEVMKNLPEEVQKKLEAQNEEYVKLQKRVADMEADAEKKEFINKAENLKYVPGMSSNELADVLMIANKSLDKDAYAKIEKSFNMVNEGVKKSEIFIAKGNIGNGEDVTAIQKIESQTQEILKNNPDLDYHVTFAKVLKNSPELYTQHLQDKKGV